MRVLHVNTTDADGGAAKAAYRLHMGLLAQNIESKIFVQQKMSDDYQIVAPSGKINKLKMFVNTRMDFLLKKICGSKLDAAWNINYPIFNLAKILLDKKYDIINLHWINAGFLSVEIIGKIKTPIVWTLHDSWAFTGGCNIPYECKKYEVKCEHCGQLKENNCFDFAKYIFQRKMKTYNSLMTIVCPSQWLADCTKKSALLSRNDVRVIPNGIDIKMYQPQDKIFSRKLLGVNIEKKLILFGAMNAASDKNKGFSYLYQAIQRVYEKKENKDEIEIIVFGSKKPQEVLDFGFKVTYIGRLYDDISLSILYSAADVMVVPSKSENLPNVILEALACGTPCAGFNIGGIPDLIEHKQNGYLAQAYDINDLADGIEYVLEDTNRWEIMSKNARQKVVNNFDLHIIAKKYDDLYKEILSK